MDVAWYPVRWFGEGWGSMLNIITPRAVVPVGEPCRSCHQAIAADDSGMITGAPEDEAIWHRDCFITECIKVPPSAGH